MLVDMPTFTLTDVARDHWVDSFSITAAEFGSSSTTPWRVTKRTLRGGRRDGVDLIQVDNGVPVLFRRSYPWNGDLEGAICWRPPLLGVPVRDGPVHPNS